MFSDAEIANRIEGHRRITSSRPMICPLAENETDKVHAPRRRVMVWRWLADLARTG
jgi:hypothetical protein